MVAGGGEDREIDMEVAGGGWPELHRSGHRDGDGYRELMDSEAFH